MSWHIMNKIWTIVTVGAVLSVFRYFPQTWEIDPLSTMIVTLTVVFSCSMLLIDVFLQREKDENK